MQEESNKSTGLSEQRRRELANFLRSRRQKLKPEVAGLSLGVRRRTPGLRREEVAERARVGTTWYTWLEQARDIQASGDVLRRLAVALMLNSAETRHLFSLAGKAPPLDMESFEEETVPESLKNVMHNALQVPAVLIGARWDVLAVNDKARKVLPPIRDFDESQKRNWLALIFSETVQRHLGANWESHAKHVVAEFRASVSECLDSPWVLEVIDQMKRSHPSFAAWWREHDIGEKSTFDLKLINEETGQPEPYVRSSFAPAECPRYRLVIFTPV